MYINYLFELMYKIRVKFAIVEKRHSLGHVMFLNYAIYYKYKN